MENPGSSTRQIPKHRKSFGTMKSLASHPAGRDGYKVALGVPPGTLWRSSSRDYSMENPGSSISQIPKHRKSFGTMKSLASHFLAKAATWEL
jgi:hypothetical protein